MWFIFVDVENAELEVLSVIQEVINGFKSLKNRNCIIRLNHAHLLKAILIHFNSEKWYSDVFKILSSAKVRLNIFSYFVSFLLLYFNC